MKYFSFLLLILGARTPLEAREISYLARSPRGLLLGDAYTSRAHDEFVLFYNPANIQHRQALTFSPINPMVSSTNVFSDLERFEEFPDDDPVAITDRLVGLPIYAQMGAFPHLQMGPVAFCVFVKTETSFILRDRTHPLLNVQHIYDRGFILGGSHAIGRADGHGGRFSLGASLKGIKRAGLQKNQYLFGPDLLETLKDGVKDFHEFRDSLGYSHGEGLGVDLGANYARSLEGFDWGAGLAILDVGDTSFKRVHGDHSVPRQKMVVALGAHTSFHLGLASLTTSLDFHPTNRPIPVERMAHLGAELDLPVVSLFLGHNGGHTSYGAELDLQVAKVVGGLYEVELSSFGHKVEKSKRAVVYLSVFDLKL